MMIVREAIPKIIDLAIEMAMKDGVNGIIISCASDPGVDELRKRLTIPIVGVGSATASIALAIGDKIGVLGITDEPPKPFLRILGSNMVGYAKPQGVRTTLDIGRDLGSVISAARYLKSLGARVIALACTGYSTLGLAPIIQEDVGIHVTNSVIASASIMYSELIRTYRLMEVLGG